MISLKSPCWPRLRFRVVFTAIGEALCFVVKGTDFSAVVRSVARNLAGIEGAGAAGFFGFTDGEPLPGGKETDPLLRDVSVLSAPGNRAFLASVKSFLAVSVKEEEPPMADFGAIVG